MTKTGDIENAKNRQKTNKRILKIEGKIMT